MRKLRQIVTCSTLATLVACGSSKLKDVDGAVVSMQTEYGKVLIHLYNETPKHRDNFLKLVEDGYYNGLLFHRVINNFMIQGGDPDSRNAKPNQPLGRGGPGYTIEAEFNPMFFHKKGALAAARQGDSANPDRKSSGSQFYIVHGKSVSDAELDMLEAGVKNKRADFIMKQLLKDKSDSLHALQSQNRHDDYAAFMEKVKSDASELAEQEPKLYSAKQREAYKAVGGTPHLDGAYTVFGEVLEGLDVVDMIASVQTTPGTNRPLKDIKMKFKIVKRE